MKAHVKNALMLILYFFIAMCLLPLFDIPSRMVSEDVTYLSDGFTFELNGETYTNVKLNALEDSAVPVPVRGETFSFSVTLPEENGYSSPAVLLTAANCSVAAYLDEDAIYYDEASDTNEPVYYQGKSFHMVDLPEDYGGRTFTAVYTVMEDKSFSGIYSPTLGGRLLLLKNLIYKELRSIMVGAFMCVYGGLFIIISVFFSRKIPQLKGQVYAATLCVLVGTWNITSCNTFIYLYPGSNTTFIQYLTQFLSVVVFYVIMETLHVLPNNRVYMTIATVICFFSMSVFSIWSFRRNYTSMLLLVYIPIVFMGLLLCARHYSLVNKNRDIDYSVYMQVHGLTALLIACMVHCILYYFCDFKGIERGYFGANVMSIGISMLTISQMINFFFCVTKNIAEQDDYVPIEELAYLDTLTGLANRSRMEEIMEKVANDGQNYALIMIDINGLKKVNDEMGHVTGDHLLQEFAQVLKTVIKKSAFYARIGGDEFIIILERPGTNQPQELIDKIRSDFNEFNKKEAALSHSFAAGFALRNEVKSESDASPMATAKKVFNLADSRMYQQKSIMKRMAQSTGSVRT